MNIHKKLRDSLIEEFDNIIGHADNNLLYELRERLNKEIRLSEQAINEGFE